MSISAQQQGKNHWHLSQEKCIMKAKSCCERNGFDMKEFILHNDPARMNWVEDHTEWGTVCCADPYANDQDWGLYFALKTL